MADNIIPRSAASIVEMLPQLVYCNPFIAERNELDKKVLGSSYKDTGRAWNLRLEDYDGHPNLLALFEQITGIADKSRENLLRKKRGSSRELEQYRFLVNFMVYHRLQDDFSKCIRQNKNGKPGKEWAKIYERYLGLLDHYFMPGKISMELEFSHPRLFSIYYQLRRAFYHIFQYIIGASPTTTRLRARVWQSIFTRDMARYLRTLYKGMEDNITLITGPSGSGKELVARAIGFSRYIPFNETSLQFEEEIDKAFFPINLSALSTNLVESELFGHCKGAFTGALQDRKGYFEVCGPYGTIFLDEIGDVDTALQVKLLRVLQARQFQRLGDTKIRRFLGKIMAATNRDIVTEIRENRFREDFYYRLCADRIETPALKDIIADDPTECSYLVRYISEKIVGEEEADALAEDVCAWIKKNLGFGYPWPGNFRELEQCVRNILIHGEYHPQQFQPISESNADDFASQLEAGKLTAEEVLRHYATTVFAQTQNYGETARRLKLDWRTVKKYVDPELLEMTSTDT